MANKKKQAVFGLDIGSACVKAVQMRKDRKKYTVVAAAQTEIELSSGIDPTERVTNTVNAIRLCLKIAGIHSAQVVAGVSGTDVVVRGFRFPQMPPDVLDQAVRMEAQQVCPMDMKHSVLDYQMVGSPGHDKKAKAETVSGFLVVGTEHALQRKMKIMEQANLHPLLLDVEAMALLNALGEYENWQGQGTVAVVDVGAESTSVIVLGQDGLPFVRNLTFAGNRIIQAVADKYNLSTEKTKLLMFKKTELQNQMMDIPKALAEVCKPLMSDLRETIRYYSMQHQGHPIDRIYLCGGLAVLEEFADFVENSIPGQVRVFNPFEQMPCQAGKDGNELLRKYGPTLSVAAGLAMREL